MRIAVQALVNLASNAIQAADGPDAKVSVAGTLGRHGRAFLRVCDNGPGIPEHVRETMFRPFAGRGTERGRSGLGLFIVRQAVRRLGGTIRVETSVEGT
ncbi:MAG: sensor histidine kinase, partial [Planctomycetota bacterium]